MKTTLYNAMHSRVLFCLLLGLFYITPISNVIAQSEQEPQDAQRVTEEIVVVGQSSYQDGHDWITEFECVLEVTYEQVYEIRYLISRHPEEWSPWEYFFTDRWTEEETYDCSPEIVPYDPSIHDGSDDSSGNNSGGSDSDNSGSDQKSRYDDPNKVRCYEGNPIDVTTGQKREYVLDYQSGHAVLPLTVARLYTSDFIRPNGSHDGREFGEYWQAGLWRSSNHYRLMKYSEDVTYGRANFHFQRGLKGIMGVITYDSHASYASRGETVPLTKTATGWEYLNREENLLETYDSEGKLLRITDVATKIYLEYSYNGDRLTRVRRIDGAELLYSYDDALFRITITLPTGGSIEYHYDRESNYTGSSHVAGYSPYSTPVDLLSSVHVYTADGVNIGDWWYAYGDPETGYNQDLYRRHLLTYAGTGVNTVTAHWRYNRGVPHPAKAIYSAHYKDNGSGLEADQVVNFDRSVDGEVTVTNQRGAVTRYTLDPDDNTLITEVQGDAIGSCLASNTRNTYDSKGLLESQTSSVDYKLTGEATTTYQRNSKGWITHSVNGLNIVTETAWMEDRKIPLSIIHAGWTSEYTYYSGRPGLVVTETHGRGGENETRTSNYEFWPNGLIKTINFTETGWDPDHSRFTLQRTRQSQYDQMGRLIFVTADGHTITYSNYNAHGYPETVVRDGATTTTRSYDARGLLTSETTSNSYGSATASFTYNAEGQLQTQTSPSGQLTQYHYHHNSKQLIRIDHSPTEATEYDYDSFGKRSAVRYLKNDTVQYQRFYDTDERGRLAAIRDNAGNGPTMTYTVNNRINTKDDGRGNITETTYKDYATTVDRPGPGKHKIEHSKRGLRTRLVTSRTGYGAFERPVSSRTPLVAQLGFPFEQYKYSAPNVDTLTVATQKRTYGAGIVSCYNNDPNDCTAESRTIYIAKTASYAQDRLTSIKHSAPYSVLGEEDTTPQWQFQFQYHTNGPSAGLLQQSQSAHSAEFSRPSTQASYQYQHVLGLLTQSTHNIGSDSYSIHREYDVDGNLTALTYSSGYRVNYQRYASDGNIERITDSLGNVIVSWADYLPRGLLRAYTLGTSPQQSVYYTYNNDYRLTRINGSGMVLDYHYDGAGNITQIIDQLNTTNNISFGYDGENQLSSVTRNGNIITYNYDGDGNRTSLTASNGDNQQTGLPLQWETLPDEPYTPHSGLLTASHSVNGANHPLIYNGWGHAVSDTHSGRTREYEFNGNDQLMQITVDGVVTKYSYNASGQRVWKQTGSDVWHYIYDVGSEKLLAEYHNGQLEKEYIYFNGQLLALRKNGQNYFVYRDHLGRPLFVKRSDNTIVWQASNTEFGREVTYKDPAFGDLNIGFPGQYYDAESGLWYNWHRYYDPELGRYISSDPIGYDGGINTYTYALNNPISIVDLEGLDPSLAPIWHVKTDEARAADPEFNRMASEIDMWAAGVVGGSSALMLALSSRVATACLIAGAETGHLNLPFISRAPKRVANYTQQSRSHVYKHGHAANSPPLPNKSRFKPTEGGQKFTDEVINHPNVRVTNQSNGRTLYEVDDLGRTTGRGRDGSLVRGGSVVVEGQNPGSWSIYVPNEVVTQYPR